MSRILERESGDILTPREVFSALDRFVVGQTLAKRSIAIAAYNHMRRLSEKAAGRRGVRKKSNVLMIGPTASGWSARENGLGLPRFGGHIRSRNA